jgi:hypothetical protein
VETRFSPLLPTWHVSAALGWARPIHLLLSLTLTFTLDTFISLAITNHAHIHVF